MMKGIATRVVAIRLLAGVPAFAQEFTVQQEDVKGDEPDYSPYVASTSTPLERTRASFLPRSA